MAVVAGRAGNHEGVLVVLPAFNEAATVGSIVRGVRTLGLDAVVVDDGSTDETARFAEAEGAIVLRLPVNLGVGGALRCGFRFAVARGYETVVVCDADGQHDPAEIPRLLERLEASGADMAIGSRFLGPESAYAVDGARRTVMLILAALASRAVGGPVTDSTSGFRAVRGPLLDDFAAAYPVEYLGDTVEALVLAGDAGYRVVEEPVRMTERAAGSSTASFVTSAWYLVRVLAAMALLRKSRRERRPAMPSSHGAVP
jgi:glycosyltransferase involved in cell wall biosynthesis